MSHDLYFLRRDEAARELTWTEVRDYFAARPHYETADGEARYYNEATGVYFQFDWDDEAPADEPEGDSSASLPRAPVVFNMNYFRPHIFGLEAEPEVRAFVEHFGLLPDQGLSEEGLAEFRGDRFLAGWNRGNQLACEMVLGMGPDSGTYYTLPKARIESIWRWNYSRDARQEELTEDIFIPRIMFLNLRGKARSMCSWPNGMSILLPQVDLVYVGREMLDSKLGDALIPWSRLAELVETYEAVREPLLYYRLDYDEPPPELVDLLVEQPALKGPLGRIGVPIEQILDAELMTQAEGE
jgi:hypothetical protein